MVSYFGVVGTNQLTYSQNIQTCSGGALPWPCVKIWLRLVERFYPLGVLTPPKKHKRNLVEFNTFGKLRFRAVIIKYMYGTERDWVKLKYIGNCFLLNLTDHKNLAVCF